MAASTYPIQGVPLRNGAENLPVRKEINQWATDPKNKKELDLFLLALKQMQETPIENSLSYFQIAGIHGFPLQGWDGIPYEPNPLPNNNSGFCTHNLWTFPTWHRPYVLLFEQRLHELMKDIIQTWKLPEEEAKSWLDAAYNFRLPYWDWAQRQPYIQDFGVPEICTRDTVTVILPGDKPDTFANPLAKFSNPSGVAMGDKSMGRYAVQDNMNKGGPDGLPWSKCVATSRYGIFKDSEENPPKWINGINAWEKVNQMIKTPFWYGKKPGGAATFADAVERLLSPGYHSSFETFGCTVWNDPKEVKNTNFLSLEYIHNVAHISTGGIFATQKKGEKDLPGERGLGHMSDVPVSAFDPIFFLHHCNIDRLLAIWQTFNKGKWMDTTLKNPSTRDHLRPFHIDAEDGKWNSEITEKWTEFRYQYDELVKLKEDYDDHGVFNEERYLTRLRRYFNWLYPGSSNAVKAAPSFLSSAQEFPDYIINILYDRYALNGRAYSIMLFLGEPPSEDDMPGYTQHPNYLGQVYTFSSPTGVDSDTACGNCAAQQAQGVLSAAQVPVTLQLMFKASMHAQWFSDGQQGPAPLGIPDQIQGPLEPEVVEQIFTQQFYVKYIELGGEEHPPENFPRTEIALLHAPAKATEQDFVLDGESATSIVPTYDGQYKVLFKKFGGERAGADSFRGAGAADVGFIKHDT